MVIVQNTGNIIINVKNVVIVPGTNDLDEKDIKKIRAHPLFNSYEEDGIIVIKEGTKSTKNLNVKEAVNLIQDTYIVKTLEKWKEADSRVTIQKAIDEQIELLTVDKEEKSDDDNYV
jgi:hypothetical protein